MSHKTRSAERIIAMLLSLVMLVGLLPMSVFAADVQEQRAQTELAPGSYMVPVENLESAAPLAPVKTEFAKAFGTEVQIDVAEGGEMTATIVPQHMVVDMSSMNQGKYHCNILTVEGAAYPEMKTEKVSPTFGQPDVVQEIECPAKIVVPMPAANEKGGYVFTLTVDFMNSFLGGGLDKSYPTDVTLTLDFAGAKEIKPAGPSFEFGTAKTVLKPGKYALPVALMNSSKPDKASMAASAIKGGALEVMADGSAFVTVDVAEVKVMGIGGWASNWRVFNEYNNTSAVTAAEVTAHDEKGNETQIRFQLPFADKDGVFLQMFVSVMSKDMDGLLKMDFAKAEALEPSEPEQPAPSFEFGPEKTVLEPGKYNLPVALMNSSKPDKASMAASAIKGGALEVLEDGSAFVTVDVAEVKVMGIGGWASNWRVFNEYNNTSDVTPAEVTAHDEKGNETQIRFQLPFADKNGVFLQMFVSVMSKDMDGLLKMDFAKAQPLDKPQAPTYEFGPEKTALKPGQYDLPVSLMNAGNIGKPSMAASAIRGGSLEVLDNGDAFVNVKLGPVTVMGMTGWSSEWQIYGEYNVDSALTPAEVIAQDEAGNVTEIRFQLPYTDQDGVYAQMHVAAMNMTSDGYLKLDFAGIGRPAAPAITPAAGEYTDRVEVTIAAAEGAEIFYTTDGTVPTADSTKYTKPFTLTESAAVKAVAVKDGKTSAVAEAAYTVKPAGPVVKTGVAPVTEFGYDVTAAVTVENNTIQSVVLSDNAAEMGKDDSLDYIKIASFGMKDKFNGMKADDKAAIEGVDAVAKATVTAESYKTAVLKALDLYTPPKAPDFTFGSADTKLEPGTYVLPVSLRNADKHENPSNAVGAFAPNATLIVGEDSIATLVVEMKTVTIGPISDMAHSVKVYQEDNYTSETVDARILETVAKPEGMIEAGKIVPSKISFVIPDNNFDGVYMNFTVDAMGGATPDGWLSLNFAAAHVPGEAQHKFGEAQVDQFGKYTIHTDVTVQDGIITNVDVTADDFVSTTHKPENDVRINQVTKALKSAWNGMAPTQENAEKIFKVIMKETDPDEVIDSVSGATYSAKAVRDAVMSAFGLTYQDEIITVPETVEPGVYEVPISYYSDVVWHSLVETVKATATLTVNADKTMSLDVETKSGTEKEPLYILGFNGVYPNNDTTQKLTMEGCEAVMGLSSNDYEDEFFAKGTQVVNHVTFPLLGGLSKTYTTNCYLYVPAMNKLDGELSGIQFENGKFNVDVYAKIFWDDMKKVDEVPGGSVADGQYTADLLMNQDGKDKASMCDALFGPQVDITVENGMATLKVYVAYPVPSMPEAGKDGTLKNFTIDFNGRQYVAASDITSKPTFIAKASNPMFGMNKGQEVQAQVLTVELPAAALEAKHLDTSAFVNVVMNSDQYFDMVLSNLTKVEPQGQIEDGNYYVNVAMWHGDRDQASMGDSAFTNNRRVLVTVENGNVVSVQVASNPVAMGPIQSAVTKVEVILEFDAQHNPVKVQPVEILSTEKLTTKPAGNEIDYIKTFRFDMPEKYRPETLTGIGYVPVQFVAPDTPMGNEPMDARLKLDWDSAEKTSDTVLEGNSDVPTDVTPVDLMDKATGIKLNGRSDQIPSNSKLSVFKPVQGADYDMVASIMAEEGVKNWELFQINAQVGDEFIQPTSGSVEIAIPCTASGLTVYRIEDAEDGGYAIEVEGRVENGFYIFNVRGLGNFAVVGAPSVLDQFNDIPARHWGRPFIEKAVGLDLMKGNANKFSPDQKMTRAMFVTVLGNLAGVKNTDSGKTPFTDVPENAWYAPYVAWAYENGITKGVTADTFAPDATITRQEMAVFMVSYCKFAGIELEQVKTVDFKDEAAIDGWAKTAVQAVTEAGLLGETGGGNFSPKASATRAQAATLLVNFVESYPSK